MKRALVYLALAFLIVVTKLQYETTSFRTDIDIHNADMDYIDGKYAMPLAKSALEIKRLEADLKEHENEYRQKYGKEIGQ